MKREQNLPKEQKSLIIMDTFNGQDNDTIRDLSKNNCIIVIVPHNMTNKFQPLDISVNKSSKSFLSNLYNQWFSDKVATQLANGKFPCDVKISSKLLDIKPLHAKWIVALYEHLLGQKEMIINGFESAGIMEAIECAQEVFIKVENPFKE